jgi:hypothetical protein
LSPPNLQSADAVRSSSFALAKVSKKIHQMTLILKRFWSSLPTHHILISLYHKQILLVLGKNRISNLESEAKQSSKIFKLIKISLQLVG